MRLPLDSIDPPDLQLRDTVEPQALRDLADSIARRGLLQPIRVRRDGARWRIVAGFRRYLAHELLGRLTIDAIPLDNDPTGDAASSLHENLFRENLTPLEEAALIGHLIEHERMDIPTIARALNHSEAWAEARAELLTYAPALQQAIHTGTIKLNAARHLAQITDHDYLCTTLDAAQSHGMSERAAMEWARQWQVYRIARTANPDAPLPTVELVANEANLVPCEIHGGTVYWNTTKIVRVCFDCLRAILAAAKAT